MVLEPTLRRATASSTENVVDAKRHITSGCPEQGRQAKVERGASAGRGIDG